MRTILLTVLLTAALSGCTQPDEAARILQDAGYSEIRMNGYSWWGCGENDHYADAFTATGPTGRRVSGVVCAGLFWKNATIRLE